MLKVEIKTGGAAFHCEDPEENPSLDRTCLGIEVARLLDKIEKEILHGVDSGSIMDRNGNKVGEWSLE